MNGELPAEFGIEHGNGQSDSFLKQDMGQSSTQTGDCEQQVDWRAI